jgi:methylated-DNA-[protein]-cysteine S-methyltransferase
MSTNAVVTTPVGLLGMRLSHRHLVGIDFIPQRPEAVERHLSPCARQVTVQLQLYFEHKLCNFELPIQLQGSDFQKKVWQLLANIPYGSTRTYGELAQQLGTSARAIGNACRCNPIPIIIPCHRVVAANHLGGYSGDTSGNMLAIKEKLLQHENSFF